MPTSVRVIRVACWGAAAIFMIVLGVRDLGPGRTIVRTARLDAATPAISVFGPPSRVVLAPDAVRVVGEPIYVNVRLPRWFRRATVDLAYENPDGLPLRLGVVTHPTAWQFVFPAPEESNPVGAFPLPTEGELEGAHVSFDLQRAWQVERNVSRFIITAPGASSEHPVIIRSLRVTAERDPMCLGRFCV